MTLQEKDVLHIWHPYTQIKNAPSVIPIIKAQGSLLYDENDGQYIDAISSWWVNIHGHSHPYIAEKIYQQALRLEHVIFAGFTHEPAVNLGSRLLSKLPGMSKIFFSDNGSTATEVAIKMALQYFSNYGSQRKKIIAQENSYHGDTYGSMSISSRNIFTSPFEDKLFDVRFIPKPTRENVKETIAQLGNCDDIACFIYEPLLQGAGGMIMYEPEALDELLGFMHHKEILCIADEVLTGFYRTGTMFASDQLYNKPDIICLSKALTGGTMALGVTLCTQSIYDGFIHDDKTKTFFHGHSFTANPIACAASLASLDLLESENCLEQINWICKEQFKFVNELKNSNYPIKTKNHRSCGTIAAFEVSNAMSDNYLNNVSQKFTRFALTNGVYLRPLGNTIYIMPPYCITGEELKKTYAVITEYLNENED